MKRGAQVIVGGKYNKPPPGPMAHGGARVRIHDSNGFVSKDRFGPRERSPSLGSILPISPPHHITREKAPMTTSQDLHDCSMCLSAYIQSLNTVCGTACRFAQCLAQVGSAHGNPDLGGTQFPQLLKEAAEMWEGIARVVGVTSTSVKNQMILLIQELQSRNNMDFSDQIHKQEISKHLKDENVGSNGYFVDSGLRPNLSPNVSPHRPSPSPPNIGIQPPLGNMMNMSPRQLLQCQQQQQQLLLQQQQQLVLQQHFIQMAQQQQQFMHSNPTASTISENSPIKDEDVISGSCQSSAGAAQAFSGSGNYFGGWPTGSGSPGNAGHPLNSCSNMNANQGSASTSTLSPGLYSNLSSAYGSAFGDWGSDSVARRWSMGGSAEEGRQERRSSLTPFTLMANRRWSVPETAEHDPNSTISFGGLQSLSGSFNGNDCNSVFSGNANSFYSGTRHNLQPVSRESSCTRSPSHSRSVTPEQRRTNSVTNEDLEDVINLLSMPLGLSSRKSSKSSGCSLNSYDSVSPRSSISSYTDQNKKQLKHQRIPEVNQESQTSPIKPHPSPQHNSALVDCHTLQVGIKSNQQLIDTGQKPDFPCADAWPSALHDGGQLSNTKVEVEAKGDTETQISTPLWPPTDSVPGVTLTECIGEEEKIASDCWLDSSGCNTTSAVCGSRDSISRSSWPNTAFGRLGVLDDIGLYPGGQSASLEKGWTQLPISAFRRHSSDAPFILPQSSAALNFRTRSFENIAKMSDPVDKENCFDSNIHRLLCLSSLTSPETSPVNSQYTLFNSMTT